MSETRATGCLRAALQALALAVCAQAVAGFAGVLYRPVSIAILAASLLALLRGLRRHLATPPGAPWTRLEIGLGAALVALLGERLWAGLHATEFHYDVLSFHLHFPVAWLQAHRIEIVPTPFGDLAPAYGPSNAELLYELVLAPLRSDALARVGQLPFAALAALALYATVRASGGSRSGGLAAALALLMVPEVYTQIPSAMVDLAVAALFLSSLHFLVRLGQAPSVADARAGALALGLCVGTKFVALPLSAALAALAVAVALHHRARWRQVRPATVLGAAALALASGGFWYVRNWIVTGNPLYPLAIGPFCGLYDSALMRAWDYHVPVGELGALGRMLGEAGVGFVVAALIAFTLGRRFVEAALAAALVAIVWFWVPYQHSRFLFPAFGVAALAIGAATAAQTGPGQPGEPGGPVWLGFLILGAATLGSLIEFPTGGRLAVAGAGLAFALVPARARRLVAAAAGAVLVGMLARTSPPAFAIGDGHDPAWRWLDAHGSGARLAYAGDNLPVPLYGPGLRNHVQYVSVTSARSARVHDLPGTCGAGHGAAAASPPRTAEPAPYRQPEDPAAWLANLRALRTDTLFVAKMDPIVARNVRPDADGFPAERAWADAHPEWFQLRYASPAVRIYGVAIP
ncbi:MAG TPA: glycosyltransferase family 39 protein [Polyangia bacterium]|nr:glycosyltransferase family 39 protein [Polyangia bacterium]